MVILPAMHQCLEEEVLECFVITILLQRLALGDVDAGAQGLQEEP